MSSSLLLKQVRPFNGTETVDVLIKDGTIVEIGASISSISAQTEIIEGNNQLLLPGFIDGHAHIDKSLWGREWYENDVPRNLPAIIANERAYRREHHPDPQLQSERIARHCISRGTSFIRTHIDVDNEIGVSHVEGVLETREKLAHAIDIETVAFPQSGILENPGAEKYLEQALILGADYIGVLDPCTYEKDPIAHLNIIFRLAAKYDKGVDIHLHERGEVGAFSVERILDKTREFGLAGKVTISHAFCLGMVEADRQKWFAEQLAELGISIATTAPVDVAVPPYLLLREHGVDVCAGNDGIRDTWSPYGNGDMLHRAMMVGLRYRWRKDSEMLNALDAITYGGARVMKRENYGIEVGCHADLVLLPARVLAEAIVAQPMPRTVIKHGKVVATAGECLF
ncbi:amidohydrolase family protein [Serratia sp. M24T3]|uniref:amidohydrolase family protein n=1 Tax=Serratia sp. M24T3 TaxID=932213 RepID=UPI00025BA2E9|nr:amidohydrolase family protein [Serratia sp. M24T3]EIC85230.1 cytosine deaminase [Serratia sp. M24T3]